MLKNAVIGSNCNINAHCFIENDVVFGDAVAVKCGVYLWDGITVEDRVFIGPNVTFTNDKYPRSKQYPQVFQRTVLQQGCSIGAGAIITGGVTIGRGALVGAGSLETKDVPPFQLWYGSPASHRGYVLPSGEKLSLDLLDSQDRQYEYKGGDLILVI
ncbi:MAG: acyltransferase [Breznakibacter sp.]